MDLNFKNKDIENAENNIDAEEENNKNVSEHIIRSMKKVENDDENSVSNSEDSDELSSSIVRKKHLKKLLKCKINI